MYAELFQRRELLFVEFMPQVAQMRDALSLRLRACLQRFLHDQDLPPGLLYEPF